MYPIFRIDQVGTLPAIAAGQALFGIAATAIMGLVPTLLSEFFPTTVRMSGLSVAYTLANALFGGTAPFVVLWLVGLTGNPTVICSTASLPCSSPSSAHSSSGRPPTSRCARSDLGRHS